MCSQHLSASSTHLGEWRCLWLAPSQSPPRRTSCHFQAEAFERLMCLVRLCLFPHRLATGLTVPDAVRDMQRSCWASTLSLTVSRIRLCGVLAIEISRVDGAALSNVSQANLKGCVVMLPVACNLLLAFKDTAEEKDIFPSFLLFYFLSGPPGV